MCDVIPRYLSLPVRCYVTTAVVLLVLLLSGPQPQVQDSSVLCRTSTASSGCSPPAAGPQPQAPAGPQMRAPAAGGQCSPPDINCELENMPDKTPERMSEDMNVRNPPALKVLRRCGGSNKPQKSRGLILSVSLGGSISSSNAVLCSVQNSED